MKALLVIDAAGGAVSVALAEVENGRVLAGDARAMPRGQVEALLPMIAALRTDAGIAFPDLTAIAATTGPGSFTGIRLGLAAARGIGLAAARPVFGIGSFAATLADARARGAGTGRVLILLDSKRRDLFAQVFDTEGQPLTEAAVLSPEALRDLAERLIAADGAPLRVIGDAAALPALDGLAVERVPSGPPSLEALAGLAATFWRTARDTGAGLPAPAPLYLRPPDAIVPDGGGVLPHLRGGGSSA